MGGWEVTHCCFIYCFQSIQKELYLSSTPLNKILNDLNVALKLSAEALLLLLMKKFRIPSFVLG
jgi:hypothetical protein